MRTLDIFCGGGGSSFGARQAGADIVCGIDFDEVATSIYSMNFPEAAVLTSRLEDVKPKSLHRSIGDIDLLLASPECTNHTCARGAAPRSEASRATAMQVIRYAKEFRPQWVVMENVIHMRPWSRYAELKSSLEGLGYNVHELVLDASDFGVAQSRRRLFVVCGLGVDSITIRTPRRRKRKTVRDILDRPGTWKTSPLITNRRAKATLERAQRGIEALGDKASFLIVYYGTDGSGGWQPLDRPLRTITTVDRFALVEPYASGHEMRMLQVPELARAMGFSKDYRLDLGTRREKVRVLGNGVCPPVMADVVRSLNES